MTEEQYSKKVLELLDIVHDELATECGSLWRSGGIDKEAYGDDYRLPKILLAAAMKRRAGMFHPLHPEDAATVKNLERI